VAEMVRIRLKRVGAKAQPSYRVVVTEARSPRDGRFIEEIGYYHPRQNPPGFYIREERARHWLACGAQPSQTVRTLLRRAGLSGGDGAPEAAPKEAEG
jgi:small subunit ribosomal protein S16